MQSINTDERDREAYRTVQLFAWPFFAVVIFGLIILTILETRGPSREEERWITEVCSKVNNDNWYTAQWEPRSASEVCHLNGAYLIGDHPRVPCSFGGLPYFCYNEKDGAISIRSFATGARVAFISPADKQRVEGHLVLLY